MGFMINSGHLKLACDALRRYYSSKDYVEHFETEKLANIVIAHAASAAVAAMAGGVLPGVAAVIASGIAVAAIWSMYYRIAKYLGIGLSLDTLKALASALNTNLVTQIGGVLLLDLAFSLVPGISIVAGGLMNFVVVYVAGIMYLHMLADIFKAGKDPKSMDVEALKKAYSGSAAGVDVKAACSEAKSAFKDMRESGNLKEKAGEGKSIN